MLKIMTARMPRVGSESSALCWNFCVCWIPYDASHEPCGVAQGPNSASTIMWWRRCFRARNQDAVTTATAELK
eukprot:4225342-Amphidinium_carterae.1